MDPPAGHFQFDASYEAVRAARWRGYLWEIFDTLDPDDQALVIAEYRIEMRYQAVDTWENRPKAKPPKASTTARRRRKH